VNYRLRALVANGMVGKTQEKGADASIVTFAPTARGAVPRRVIRAFDAKGTRIF